MKGCRSKGRVLGKKDAPFYNTKKHQPIPQKSSARPKTPQSACEAENYIQGKPGDARIPHDGGKPATTGEK